MENIKKTIFWRGLKKIKWLCVELPYKIRFNRKPLDAVQGEIQKAIKKRNDIYFHDEKTARQLADNWNGLINKPQDLRFIEHAIPIVLSANEAFVPYMAVTLRSLLNNSNSKRKYHFIILERDFSDKTKDLMRDLVSNFSHCVIDFVNTANVLNEIANVSLYAYLSIDTFSRLFIPYWFDKYERVIYLDSDIVVKADIAELYDTDISNFCLGAAVDQVAGDFLKIKKHTWFIWASPVFMLLDNWHRYFNAGVLIFDTQQFKVKIPPQYLFRFTIYFINRYAMHFGDQEVLNLLIKDDYYVLPPEWNYQWNRPSKKKGPELLPAEPGTKIIHFTTSLKPWKDDLQIGNNIDVLEWRKLAESVPLFGDNI
jgi:lipopolysaccharide biosynthesis glycosyltransferase